MTGQAGSGGAAVYFGVYLQGQAVVTLSNVTFTDADGKDLGVNTNQNAGSYIIATTAPNASETEDVSYEVEISNKHDWTLTNRKECTGPVKLTYTVESYTGSTEEGKYSNNNGVTATKAPKASYPYTDDNGLIKYTGDQNVIMKPGYTYSFNIVMDGTTIVYHGSYKDTEGNVGKITFTNNQYGSFSGELSYFGIYVSPMTTAKLVNVTCTDAEGNDLGLQSNNSMYIGQEDETYKYLSFHDYKIQTMREEIPATADSTVIGITGCVDTLDKVIFSGNVIFNGEGADATHTLRVGGTANGGDYQWYGIGIYVKGSSLYAVNLETKETVQIGTATLGQSVNFSIQFDKRYDGLWTVTYTVGNTKTTVSYNQSRDFGNYMIIHPTGTTMSLTSVDGNNPIQEKTPVSYDLADGDYLASGQCTVADADGEIVTLASNDPTIKDPGDYTILTKAGSFQYKQKVSLYRIGDVDLNGTAGERADLEALEKLVNGVSLKYAADCAAEYAADLNNDEKVGAKDLELMQNIANKTTTLQAVLDKYHVPTISYDYLGGDEVMPIAGYFTPYFNSTYNYLTNEIYQLIKESGVNILIGNTGNTFNDDYIYRALELGEKYGLGYYVEDLFMNPERPTSATTASNVDKTEGPTFAEIAEQVGKYSYHENYLGTYVVDEPTGNKYTVGTTAEELAIYNKQLQFFDWLASKMNSFTNNIGYINIASTIWTYHTSDFKTTYDELKNDCNAKLFSYDYYPFASGKTVEGGMFNSVLGDYYSSLWQTREKSLQHGVPFWAFVEAGGDFRDSKSTDATDTSKIPTEAETYWNVNNYLAFGAKGIQWFTAIQPYWFSYSGEGNDFDRSGLIGADGTTTPFYTYAQNMNAQIAAVDDVLMKATSTGIMATGTKTKRNLNAGTGCQLITSTDKLQSFTGGDSSGHGGILGCFDYGDTEAFYLVNDNVTAKKGFTLTFKAKQNYRVVINAQEYIGSGSKLSIDALGAGEGALIVLEEEDNYYTDEPDEAVEITATDVRGTEQNITISWGATESLAGSTESGSIAFEPYGEQTVVYLNGEAITPTITETKRNTVWGLTLDLSSYNLTDGDVITIGGTIYPTSGDKEGRLISIHSHDYLWSDGTWSLKHEYVNQICEDCGQIEEGYTEEYGYYSVATYKAEGAEEAYPTKEGMLFAGWFTDSTCKTAYKASTGFAYAKFVDAGVLASLAQIPADTEYDTEVTKMRLVSTVDSSRYKTVGFIIEVEGSTKGATTVSTRNVYEAIKTTEGGVEFTKTPTDINPNSKYFFTYTITDIDNENFDTKIYVTPYWITLDGTQVTGERALKTVNLGIKANNTLDGKEEGDFEETPW